MTAYIDSSVLLRAFLSESPAALSWLQQTAADPDAIVLSTIGRLEVRRVLFSAGATRAEFDEFARSVPLIRLDDAITDEAEQIECPVKSADSMHLALAARLGVGNVMIATHDAQMARAAKGLGFTVVDPVTDDPNRPPVA